MLKHLVLLLDLFLAAFDLAKQSSVWHTLCSYARDGHRM